MREEQTRELPARELRGLGMAHELALPVRAAQERRGMGPARKLAPPMRAARELPATETATAELPMQAPPEHPATAMAHKLALQE